MLPLVKTVVFECFEDGNQGVLSKPVGILQGLT